MSFRGSVLVIDSLALSRIWYVATLVHMPLWVHAELVKMMFPSCWKWKPELVTRDVVTQPPTASGFSVVNIKLKVVPCWVSGYGAMPPPRPAR